MTGVAHSVITHAMNWIYDFFEVVQSFMSRGGGVLYLIFIAIFVLWALAMERFWYFRFHFKKDSAKLIQEWQNYPKSADSLLLSKVKMADISYLAQLLNKNMPFIKTLITLCPLLGLLGTVTGMVAVFEVMAQVGTGNARLMASGISMATIPTMAGMVGALSGIFVCRVLENQLNKKKQELRGMIV